MRIGNGIGEGEGAVTALVRERVLLWYDGGTNRQKKNNNNNNKE